MVTTLLASFFSKRFCDSKNGKEPYIINNFITVITVYNYTLLYPIFLQITTILPVLREKYILIL
jgi:hypothetical protein